MKMPIRRKSRRWLSALAILSAVFICVEPATASPKTPEAAIRQADDLMQQLKLDGKDAALSDAQSLSRPEDSDFSRRLAQQRQIADARASKLGAVENVRFVEETHLGEACMERAYRVRYAGGQQTWRLKLRRGAHGWFLSDLFIVDPST